MKHQKPLWLIFFAAPEYENKNILDFISEDKPLKLYMDAHRTLMLGSTAMNTVGPIRTRKRTAYLLKIA